MSKLKRSGSNVSFRSSSSPHLHSPKRSQQFHKSSNQSQRDSQVDNHHKNYKGQNSSSSITKGAISPQKIINVAELEINNGNHFNLSKSELKKKNMFFQKFYKSERQSSQQQYQQQQLYKELISQPKQFFSNSQVPFAQAIKHFITAPDYLPKPANKYIECEQSVPFAQLLQRKEAKALFSTRFEPESKLWNTVNAATAQSETTSPNKSNLDKGFKMQKRSSLQIQHQGFQLKQESLHQKSNNDNLIQKNNYLKVTTTTKASRNNSQGTKNQGENQGEALENQQKLKKCEKQKDNENNIKNKQKRSQLKTNPINLLSSTPRIQGYQNSLQQQKKSLSSQNSTNKDQNSPINNSQKYQQQQQQLQQQQQQQLQQQQHQQQLPQQQQQLYQLSQTNHQKYHSIDLKNQISSRVPSPEGGTRSYLRTSVSSNSFQNQQHSLVYQQTQSDEKNYSQVEKKHKKSQSQNDGFSNRPLYSQLAQSKNHLRSQTQLQSPLQLLQVSTAQTQAQEQLEQLSPLLAHTFSQASNNQSPLIQQSSLFNISSQLAKQTNSISSLYVSPLLSSISGPEFIPIIHLISAENQQGEKRGSESNNINDNKQQINDQFDEENIHQFENKQQNIQSQPLKEEVVTKRISFSSSCSETSSGAPFQNCHRLPNGHLKNNKISNFTLPSQPASIPLQISSSGCTSISPASGISLPPKKRINESLCQQTNYSQFCTQSHQQQQIESKNKASDLFLQIIDQQKTANEIATLSSIAQVKQQSQALIQKQLEKKNLGYQQIFTAQKNKEKQEQKNSLGEEALITAQEEKYDKQSKEDAQLNQNERSNNKKETAFKEFKLNDSQKLLNLKQFKQPSSILNSPHKSNNQQNTFNYQQLHGISNNSEVCQSQALPQSDKSLNCMKGNHWSKKSNSTINHSKPDSNSSRNNPSIQISREESSKQRDSYSAIRNKSNDSNKRDLSNTKQNNGSSKRDTSSSQKSNKQNKGTSSFISKAKQELEKTLNSNRNQLYLNKQLNNSNTSKKLINKQQQHLYIQQAQVLQLKQLQKQQAQQHTVTSNSFQRNEECKIITTQTQNSLCEEQTTQNTPQPQPPQSLEKNYSSDTIDGLKNNLNHTSLKEQPNEQSTQRQKKIQFSNSNINSGQEFSPLLVNESDKIPLKSILVKNKNNNNSNNNNNNSNSNNLQSESNYSSNKQQVLQTHEKDSNQVSQFENQQEDQQSNSFNNKKQGKYNTKYESITLIDFRPKVNPFKIQSQRQDIPYHKSHESETFIQSLNSFSNRLELKPTSTLFTQISSSQQNIHSHLRVNSKLANTYQGTATQRTLSTQEPISLNSNSMHLRKKSEVLNLKNQQKIHQQQQNQVPRNNQLIRSSKEREKSDSIKSRSREKKGTDDSVKLNKRYESSVKTVSPFKNLKESNQTSIKIISKKNILQCNGNSKGNICQEDFANQNEINIESIREQ